MHSRRLSLAFVTSLTFTFVTAQTARPAAPDLNYAILLGISEAIDDGAVADAALDPHVLQAQLREMQSMCAEHLPAVPDFADAAGRETPELARLIQLATARRLRGESIEAASYYAQVVRLSQNPIHLHFYAETARANGDDLLADLLAEHYAAGRVTGASDLVHVNSSLNATARVRLAGVTTHATTAAPLRYVEVRVLDPLSLSEHAAVTDANGLFVIDGLTEGATLSIRATLDHFDTNTQDLKLDGVMNARMPIVGTRIYLQPSTSTAAVN